MVDIQEQYGADGLAIVAIDIGESAEVVRAFAQKQGVNYVNLLGNEEVLRAYRVTAHPLTVSVTPGGRIYSQHRGWREKEVLEREVRTLLGLSTP